MALNLEEEIALKAAWEEKLEEGEAVDKLRAHCMIKGTDGLRDLSNTLKDLDEEGQITEELLLTALEQRGIGLDAEIVHELFESLDTDGAGVIRREALLEALRPPIVDTRKILIEEAYDKLNPDGGEILAAAALRDNLNCEFHPMFASGEWEAEEVMEKYVESLTGGRDEITKDGFIAYYAAISSQIEDDEAFETLMRTAWSL